MEVRKVLEAEVGGLQPTRGSVGGWLVGVGCEVCEFLMGWDFSRFPAGVCFCSEKRSHVLVSLMYRNGGN